LLIQNGINIKELRRKSFFYSLKDLYILIKLIKRNNPIYIWEPPTFLNPIIALSVKIFSKSGIRGRHNPISYDYNQDGSKLSHPLLVRAYERLNLFFDRLYTAQHVQNSNHLNYLRSVGMRNVELIPDCTSLEPYKQGSKFDKFSILFLGRLNYHKGADRIPEIINGFFSHIPDGNVHIVGNGIYEKLIKSVYGTDPRVYFHGFSNEEEKNNILAKTHVLVAPTRVEAFMISGIEALRSGTPVISFAVPGPTDYIQNGMNGFICENEVDCVNSIFKLYNLWKNGSYPLTSNKCIESSYPYDCEKVIYEFGEMLRRYAR
jgi:glycosyltransferase involved in cell wall biosynthesis